MKGTTRQFNFAGKRSRGFSLLEMIVVLGIIGLILSVSVAVLGKSDDSSKIAMTVPLLTGVETKLREYQMLGGMYPSQAQGLEALVSKPSVAPVPKRYNSLYDELPPDPWGGALKYYYPGRKDPRKPEIVSAGPDGQLDTEDDISTQD